uniref:Uncharacterized protein n=1 Tax=Ditylenchus dipsaci TaxID=166011 RepID=A0A915DK89_9BILA
MEWRTLNRLAFLTVVFVLAVLTIADYTYALPMHSNYLLSMPDYSEEEQSGKNNRAITRQQYSKATPPVAQENHRELVLPSVFHTTHGGLQTSAAPAAFQYARPYQQHNWDWAVKRTTTITSSTVGTCCLDLAWHLPPITKGIFLSIVLIPLTALFMIFGQTVAYVFQYVEIVKKKNAVGFSLYVCLALLVANVFKIFFWVGKRFRLGVPCCKLRHDCWNDSAPRSLRPNKQKKFDEKVTASINMERKFL